MRRSGVPLAINCAPDNPSVVSSHTGSRSSLEFSVPRLRPVVLSGLGLGVLFGSLDVGVVAFTAEQGNGEFAGIALACFAAASMVGGILYGIRPWPGSVLRHTQIAAAATAAVMLIVPPVPAAMPPWPRCCRRCRLLRRPHVDWPVHPDPGLGAGPQCDRGSSPGQTRTRHRLRLGSAVAGILVDAYGPRLGLGTGLARCPVCYPPPPSLSGRRHRSKCRSPAADTAARPTGTGMERRPVPGPIQTPRARNFPSYLPDPAARGKFLPLRIGRSLCNR